MKSVVGRNAKNRPKIPIMQVKTFYNKKIKTFKFFVRNCCFFKITYLYCAQREYKALIINVFRITQSYNQHSI